MGNDLRGEDHNLFHDTSLIFGWRVWVK